MNVKDCDRRFIAAGVELRARASEESEEQFPNITGYGAVFYNPDDPGTEYRIAPDFVERIMPGAFARALKERDDCRSCFNHDPNYILGRTTAGTLTLSQDAKGLRYVVDPPENQVGKYVTMAVERGDVTGSSFMFFVDEHVIRYESEILIREITSVTLLELGPIVFPAYESTTAQLSSRTQQLLTEFRSSRGATTWQRDAMFRQAVILADKL